MQWGLSTDITSVRLVWQWETGISGRQTPTSGRGDVQRAAESSSCGTLPWTQPMSQKQVKKQLKLGVSEATATGQAAMVPVRSALNSPALPFSAKNRDKLYLLGLFTAVSCMGEQGSLLCFYSSGLISCLACAFSDQLDRCVSVWRKCYIYRQLPIRKGKMEDKKNPSYSASKEKNIVLQILSFQSVSGHLSGTWGVGGGGFQRNGIKNI